MARIWVDLTARNRGASPLFVSFDSGPVEWGTQIQIDGPSRLVFEPDGHDNGRHVILFADDEDVSVDGH